MAIGSGMMKQPARRKKKGERVWRWGGEEGELSPSSLPLPLSLSANTPRSPSPCSLSNHSRSKSARFSNAVLCADAACPSNLHTRTPSTAIEPSQLFLKARLKTNPKKPSRTETVEVRSQRERARFVSLQFTRGARAQNQTHNRPASLKRARDRPAVSARDWTLLPRGPPTTIPKPRETGCPSSLNKPALVCPRARPRRPRRATPHLWRPELIICPAHSRFASTPAPLHTNTHRAIAQALFTTAERARVAFAAPAPPFQQLPVFLSLSSARRGRVGRPQKHPPSPASQDSTPSIA